MKNLIKAVAAAGILAVAPAQVSAENINIGNGTYNFTREVDREVAPGVRYTYFTCSSRGTYGTHVYVTEVDLTNPNVRIEYLTANGTMGGSTKSLAKIAEENTSANHKIVAGANASFWITSETPWKSQLQYYPHGTAISNGTFYSINPRDGVDSHVGGPTSTGSIAIGKDGRAYIKRFFFHSCVYNPRIGHYLDIRDMNRVVTEGSANIYTPGYGRDKAFKPVNGSSSWTIAPGTCTEILCSLADGQTLNAPGDTKYIIKEVRTGAGTGTLGNYDLAIVGRDISGAPYATVMSQNYKVGDEITLQLHCTDPKYQVTDWGNSAQQPQIMGGAWENATSGNCVTMENGVLLGDGSQASYNGTVYARTLYGTNNDGTKLWIAVCGNKTSTYYGMTTTQMTYFLKYLGATYASQVDCGGSSQMYVDGSQVNKSTDSSGVRNVHSGIFVVSTGGSSQTADPSITTDATNCNFGTIAVGGSTQKQFTVTGANLQGDINMSITGANASSFVVTPNTILKANQKGTITVKYAPTSGGTHTATLNIATAGVTTKTFTLTGSADAVANASAIYQDDAAAFGVTATDTYDMEVEYADFSISELAGKTVKRVIARGDILYILAHDSNNYPTVVVFNHTAKQVVRKLGVENAVGSQSDDQNVNISDIAITADGVLVGMRYAKQPFQGEAYAVTYRWQKNANDGLAEGQPYHWNFSNIGGNYTNAYNGETIAMQGRYSDGRFVYTSQTTAGSGIRFSIQQLGYVNVEGQIQSAWHNNLNAVTGYSKDELGNPLLFASPYNENNVILQSDKKAGAEFALSGTAAGVPTKVADVPSVIPAEANHTGIYRYGGKIYMTSATFSGGNSNGVMLVDITDGLASGKKVSLSQSSMTGAPGKVATVGTGVITMDGDKFVEARMAIIAVRNGAITKFITPSSLQTPVPDEPTLITTAMDTDFGTVEIGESSTRSFNVEGYSLEGNVTITVTGNAFSVTPNGFAKDDANGTVEVTFTPTEVGEATGTLTISTPGVDPVTVNLKGKGVEEIITTERSHMAYDLESEELSDNETVIVRFKLSGDVANARIVFTPQTRAFGTLITDDYIHELGATEAGEYEIVLAKNELPYSILNWTVEVENHPVAASGKVWQYNPNPGGNSKGGIGLIETGKLHGYLVASTGNAKGFTVLSPDYAPVGPQYDADYFNNYGAKPAWTVGNVSSPYRLAIHDGIAYAIDYADAGAGIYIFNPEYPEYGTGNIFANGGAAIKDSGGCWTLNGVALGGGGSGLCFTGSGADTRLWSFQEDYPSGNANPQYVCSWNIGTTNLISSAPTKYEELWGNSSNSSGKLLNINVNLFADGDNGIFLTQNRTNNSANVLYYIDLNGNIIYDANDDKPFTGSAGGIAINSTRDMFAISENGGGITLYDVTWNGNKPTFTRREVIDSATNGVQMTFDAAGNLAVYQQGAGVNVYAIKHEAGRTASTPASMTINATTTAVSNVGVDAPETESPVYYNINGVRMPDGVDKLVPGIYLKVTGKTVEKVRVN